MTLINLAFSKWNLNDNILSSFTGVYLVGVTGNNELTNIYTGSNKSGIYFSYGANVDWNISASSDVYYKYDGEVFGVNTNNFANIDIFNNNAQYNYIMFANNSNDMRQIKFIGNFSTVYDLRGNNLYLIETSDSIIYFNTYDINSSDVVFAGILSSDTKLTSTSFPCFLENSFVCGPNGETKINLLKHGDEIFNKNMEIVHVNNVWYKTCYIASDPNVLPHIMPKNCLGTTPNKDLYISPEHGVYINDKMIRAHKLGYEKFIPELPFTYWNVDLIEGYGSMIVNGVPVETFLVKKMEKRMNKLQL